ncbi:MAG: fructose-bisphosphate aldolase [Candidatus Tokpelaia sp. JSC188]|nr:MAG: fructose-bisphosphate aldolase [Candidatus Tokpelaia sp. JSC188]
MERLEDIAHALVAEGKGILAADESSSTIKKRFDTIHLESTEKNRRDYREMLFSTKEAMKEYISGVILYDETIRQTASDGSMMTNVIKASGSLPGIKVDLGSKLLPAFPNEKITEGLDGLRDRLKEYYKFGARFAKWRAVITIDKMDLPTRFAVKQNAYTMALYAALCQEIGIVPIVEPEVVMDGKPGNHSIDRCYDVTKCVLEQVFRALSEARVKLDKMLLKPNMVIDGENARYASVEEVAEKTLRCLKETVPAAVPGIVFLSGGQSDEEATAHLSAMNAAGSLPWTLTFSYGRALQAAAMRAWGGKKENVVISQRAFFHRVRMNHLAALGKWSQQEEKAV